MAQTNIDDDPTIRSANDKQKERHSRCLTVLSAGIVCPHSESGQTGASAGEAAIDAPDPLILCAIEKHNGSLIKTVEGSLMAEFSDSCTAVHAAVEMQRQWVANQTLPQDKQRGLRLGIYSLKDHLPGIKALGSMAGAAANIASQAACGQILISREAHQAVSKQHGPHSHWFRAIKIDNLADNEDLFEVSWREAPLNIPARYEILCQVGRGGMGIVHKVRDLETDEIIALKILKPEIAEDPAMQESLRREVCLARKVTHKNVCRIHEFNRSNGAAFISMEFVKGESLLSMLHRVGPLSWSEVLPGALQICAGLREAHLQGIVHRDLKPANIMVDSAGGVKIMDFGIARLCQGTGEVTGTMVGTPAYMAPEQLELKRVDAHTDIYALGLLLYEMVTGIQPFVGQTPIAVALKQLRESPRAPREVIPTVPAHAEALILKCMQKDPAKRFQSIDELARALKRQGAPRPAASHWDFFVADFRRTGEDLERGFQFCVRTAKGLLKRQQGGALTPWSPKNTIAAGIGMACVFIVLMVLSVMGVRKSRVAGPGVPATPTIAAKLNSPPSALAASAAISINPKITGFDEVDLEPGSSTAAEKDLSDIPATPEVSSTPAVPPAESPAKSNVARTIRNVKAHLTAGLSTPPLPVLQPEVAELVSTVAFNDASKPAADDAVPDVSGPASGATPLETAKEKTTPEIVETPPALPALYLEVGSFKDSKWADNAVDKLTQLGYHSISVRKSHLWMQTYQVRVGPYTDQKGLEEARQNLASQGFKPRPAN